MRKYQKQHPIGNGNFSSVFKGVIMPEGISCAIKIMTTHDNIAVRQAHLLKKLKHPNIVSIIDFEQNKGQSRLILQYVGINTLELYEAQSYGLRQQQVKCILFQAALGLSCVHSFGIIHRDIKPQNILIDKKLAIVKLIDFGLSIEDHKCVTDYIATRWYRSPENLLGTRQYSCAIDIFSLGCVAVQLYLGSPLFPGSNNIDQIHKIFNILGFPTAESWPKGYQKMKSMGIKESTKQKTSDIDLKSIMNPQDIRLVQIISKMLQLNPKKRITAIQILKHEYFKDIKSIVPPYVYQRFEQDILKNNLKPTIPRNLSTSMQKKTGLNFDSLHNVTKKYSKVNGQNSSKSRQYELNESKSIESPQFLRQKKSSSLDYSNKAESLAGKMVTKQKGLLPSHLKRKTSTPGLVIPKNTNPNSSPIESPRVPAIFKQPKLKSPRQEVKKNIVKLSNQIIPEQHTLQLKSSKITPDGSETTLSQISKILTPTALQPQNKHLATFSQTQNARNKFYPNIPQFPETSISQLAKHARQIASPIRTTQVRHGQKSQFLDISIQTPTQIQTPQTLAPFLSGIKTDTAIKQVSKKPQTLLHQVSNPLIKPAMHEVKVEVQKKQQIRQHPELFFKNIQTQNNVHALNLNMNTNIGTCIHTSMNVKDQISPRYYISPTHRHPVQQDPQHSYRNANVQTANKVVNSPSHRYFGSSPESKYQVGGGKVRLVAVNSPPPQFKSPTHRKP